MKTWAVRARFCQNNTYSVTTWTYTCSLSVHVSIIMFATGCKKSLWSSFIHLHSTRMYHVCFHLLAFKLSNFHSILLLSLTRVTGQRHRKLFWILLCMAAGYAKINIQVSRSESIGLCVYAVRTIYFYLQSFHFSSQQVADIASGILYYTRRPLCW